MAMPRESQIPIFVFGANTQGRHGKGAAYTARQRYGAIYGQPAGRQGNSYAIITKELRAGFPSITLADVRSGVDAFVRYVTAHPDLSFVVTRIGCGLAGFTEAEIRPLFAALRGNPRVQLPEGW